VLSLGIAEVGREAPPEVMEGGRYLVELGVIHPASRPTSCAGQENLPEHASLQY
jgi:hypothetical protein